MAYFAPITDRDALPPVGAHAETYALDIKRTSRNRHGSFVPFELAKDVAAFANATGGVLLIGADEDLTSATLREYVGLGSEQDRLEHAKAYEAAVQDRCSPVPLINPVSVSDSSGKFVLAVNVWPFPSQAVGVKVDGSKSDGYGGPSFVFPLRTGRVTAYIRPEQLAMLMDPATRRIAALLESIPPHKRLAVSVISTREGVQVSEHTFEIVRVDAQSNVLQVRGTPGEDQRSVRVPLDRIITAWQQDDDAWAIAVAGTLSESGTGAYRFTPFDSEMSAWLRRRMEDR